LSATTGGTRVDIAEDVLLEEPQRQQFTFLYRISSDTIRRLGCTNPVLVDVGDHIMGTLCERDIGRRSIRRSIAGWVESERGLLCDRVPGELNKERIWIAVRRQLLCDDQRVSRVAGGLLGK